MGMTSDTTYDALPAGTLAKTYAIPFAGESESGPDPTYDDASSYIVADGAGDDLTAEYFDVAPEGRVFGNPAYAERSEMLSGADNYLTVTGSAGGDLYSVPYGDGSEL
jgi:hypothetical protein